MKVEHGTLVMVADGAKILLFRNEGDEQRNSADVKALALARADDLGRKAKALSAMQTTLLDLASKCNGSDRPDCPIIGSISDQAKRTRPE